MYRETASTAHVPRESQTIGGRYLLAHRRCQQVPWPGDGQRLWSFRFLCPAAHCYILDEPDLLIRERPAFPVFIQCDGPHQRMITSEIRDEIGQSSAARCIQRD